MEIKNLTKKDIEFLKWMTLSIWTLLLSICFFIASYFFNAYTEASYMAGFKSNLEQCPIIEQSGYIVEIIWVRDCNTILNSGQKWNY